MATFGNWFSKNFMSKIYRTHEGKGHEQKLGNPSFTPALVASIQVSQVLKLLIGRGDLLVDKLMVIDLLDNEIEVVEVGSSRLGLDSR